MKGVSFTATLQFVRGRLLDDDDDDGQISDAEC
jgi:hypothetical protein